MWQRRCWEMKLTDPDNLVGVAHAMFCVALLVALLWMFE